MENIIRNLYNIFSNKTYEKEKIVIRSHIFFRFDLSNNIYKTDIISHCQN